MIFGTSLLTAGQTGSIRLLYKHVRMCISSHRQNYSKFELKEASFISRKFPLCSSFPQFQKYNTFKVVFSVLWIVEIIISKPFSQNMLLKLDVNYGIDWVLNSQGHFTNTATLIWFEI
jgi:hypothetical protein